MALTKLQPSGVNASADFTFANVTSTSFFLGDGGLLSNIAISGGTSILNGNSNVVIDPNGNVRFSTTGLSNILIVSNTAVITTGNLISGNADLGNLAVANYFSGNGSLLSGIAGGNVTGQVGYAAVANSVAGSNVSGQVGNALIAGTVYTNSQPNITSVGSLTELTVSNSSGTVNFITTANVSLGAVGNVHITGGSSGQYLRTDGSGTLSWNSISSSSINNGTSNVNIPVGDGNVTISVGGVANMLTVTSTGANVNGTFNVVGNANVGNIGASILVSGVGTGTAPLTVSSTTRVSNLNVSYSNVSDYGVVTAQSTGTYYPALLNGSSTGNYALAANSGISMALATGTLSASYFTGTLTTGAQPNITSVGTLVNTTMGSANSLSGGNLVSATYLTGTLTTKAQPNITSTGTLTDLIVSGNLTVGGTTTYVNVTNTAITDPMLELGGGANGAALSTNDAYDRGLLLHTRTGGVNTDLFMGYDNSNAEFAFGNSVTVASEVVTFNTFGNLRAGYLFGNATHLTGVIANANYAAFAGVVTTNAQPNITSVGTLSSLTVGPSSSITLSGTAGYIQGNAMYGRDGTAAIYPYYNTVPGSAGVRTDLTVGVGGTGNLTVNGTGSITGNANVGNLGTAGQVVSSIATGTAPFVVSSTTRVSNLNVSHSNVSDYEAVTAQTTGTFYPVFASGSSTANYALGANSTLKFDAATGNLSASLLTGTLTTAAQPNITSVGTMQSITMAAATSLSGGNLLSANYVTGTLITAAQPNITSTGTMQSITMAAGTSLSGGNLLSANYVTGTLTTAAQPNITSVGTLVNTTMGSANSLSGGNLVSATYLTGTLTTAVQPNITSVGTLNALGVASGALTTASSPITITQTWNNSSVTFTGIQENITNTASAAGSLLMDLQVGGVSQFKVSSTGTTTLAANGNIALSGTLSQVTGANLISGTYLTGTLTTAPQPNITSLGTLVGLTVSNLSGTVNFISTANVSLGAVANLHISGGSSGQYLTTDGLGALSWNTVSQIANGTSNVSIPASGGNVNTSVGGTANVLIVTATGANIAGYVAGTTLSSNIATGTAPLTITSTTRVSNLNVAYANVSDFNVITAQTTGTFYPVFVNGSTTSNYALGANSVLKFDAATGNLSTTLLTGTLTAASASQPNITSHGTLNALSIASGALTTASAPVTVTQTWNNASVTFTGIQENITNTASGASSLLMDLQVGGVSQFKVSPTGVTTLAANANITMSGTLSQISGANLVSATYLAGTITTAGASQPNITSHGSLVGLTVSNASGVVNFITTANVSLGAIGNLHISGGSSGQFLQTDGAGTLSWATLSSSSISNGTSNVNISASAGNVTASVGGTANVVVITSTGANINGYVAGNTIVSNIATGTAPFTVTSTTRVSNLNVAYANVSDYTYASAAPSSGTYYPVFINSTTAGNYQIAANTGYTFNASTGTVTAPILNVTGNTTLDGLLTSKGGSDTIVTITGATGTVTHDFSTGSVFYHTGIAGSFTANFTWSSGSFPTTASRAMAIVLILVQGSTAYIPSVQIDGAAQTILWSGGSAYPGNANKTDIIGLTLVRTLGGSWVVFGTGSAYS